MHPTALILFLLCAAPLAQSAVQPPAAPPAVQSPAPAEARQSEARRAELALLAEAWKQNEAAMAADYKAWRDGTQEARAKGLPREQWPASPLAKWLPANEMLADKGQPDALAWCLQQVSTSGRDLPAILACKSRWYGALVAEHADSTAMETALQWLRGEGAAGGMDAKRTQELLEQLFERTTRPAIKARVLQALPEVIARSGAPDAAKRRIELLERLAKEYPDTMEGRAAKGALNSERNLSIGAAAPDFTTKDVDGVEFKLSDYRGKVVVLDFWGFW